MSDTQNAARQGLLGIPIGLLVAALALISVLLMPLPADLPVAGQRVLATVDSIDSEADFVDGVDAALAVAGETAGGDGDGEPPPAEPPLCLSNRAITPMLEGGGSVVARLKVDTDGSGK